MRRALLLVSDLLAKANGNETCKVSNARKGLTEKRAKR